MEMGTDLKMRSSSSFLSFFFGGVGGGQGGASAPAPHQGCNIPSPEAGEADEAGIRRDPPAGSATAPGPPRPDPRLPARRWGAKAGCPRAPPPRGPVKNQDQPKNQETSGKKKRSSTGKLPATQQTAEHLEKTGWFDRGMQEKQLFFLVVWSPVGCGLRFTL